MGVQRQANFLGQQRLDVPHLRALDSATAADFDVLAGAMLAGGDPYVVRGFELVTAGMVGAPATSLQMRVAGSMLIHPLATDAGSIFRVAEDAAVQALANDSRVLGDFVTGVNYVSVDLRRSADATTAAPVRFMSPTSNTETTRIVPLGRTLDYLVVVDTLDPSSLPHLCPIAQVTVDSSGLVTAITDLRPMLFRLGEGGVTGDAETFFAWPQGRTDSTSFQGGDKAIDSLRACLAAFMTRMWELGGGERWFSATSDRDVKLCFGQPVLGNDDNFDWDLGTETVEWASLKLVFANSTATYNDITDGTAVLEDGQCLYVDVDRTSNATLTVQVADLETLGQGAVPGSRFVIAWRVGNEPFFRDKQYEAGRTFNAVASETTLGVVKLVAAAWDPAEPKVVAVDANGTLANTASSGANASGVAGTGDGTGDGVLGTGGATNGIGVRGVGTGTGDGVRGTSDNVGVRGVGGGFGVVGSVSDSQGIGGSFTGAGTGEGVRGTGGSTSGTGVKGTGGSGGGIGVHGVGTDVQPGVKAEGADGYGEEVVGGLLGGTLISVNTPSPANPGEVSSALVMQNADDVSLTTVAAMWLHAKAATTDRDGWIAHTFKNGGSDIDFIFSAVVDEDATSNEFMIFDYSEKSVRPYTDATGMWATLGSTSVAWKHTYTKGLTVPSTTLTVNSAGPTITPGDASFMHVTFTPGASGNITVAPGNDGQILVILITATGGSAQFTDNVGNLKLSSASMPASGTTDSVLTLIFSSASGSWHELARSVNT